MPLSIWEKEFLRFCGQFQERDKVCPVTPYPFFEKYTNVVNLAKILSGGDSSAPEPSSFDETSRSSSPDSTPDSSEVSKENVSPPEPKRSKKSLDHKCSECKKSFATPRGLKRHHTIRHVRNSGTIITPIPLTPSPAVPTPTVVSPAFPCGFCQKRFGNETDVEAHMLQEHIKTTSIDNDTSPMTVSESEEKLLSQSLVQPAVAELDVINEAPENFLFLNMDDNNDSMM